MNIFLERSLYPVSCNLYNVHSNKLKSDIFEQWHKNRIFLRILKKCYCFSWKSSLQKMGTIDRINNVSQLIFIYFFNTANICCNILFFFIAIPVSAVYKYCITYLYLQANLFPHKFEILAPAREKINVHIFYGAISYQWNILRIKHTWLE